MHNESIPRSSWRRSAVFLLIAIAVVATDQLSKLWIRLNLIIGQSIPETGYPRITHVRNSGAAFGMFQDQTHALIVIATIGAILILVFAFTFYRKAPFSDGWLGKISLAFILGGTVGNLIDRVRLGYVTDFIDWGWWPSFNIADSSVVFGTCLFALSLILLAKSEKQNS